MKIKSTIKISKSTSLNLTTTILATLFLLTSCNKQPVAGFEMDKFEYKAGDTVKCTNKSRNAASYQWTFPDLQTSAEKNVGYILRDSQKRGTYMIKLKCFSKKGDKTSSTQRAFEFK